MSKKPLKSIFAVLDDLGGVPSDIPVNLSPRDAAQYIAATDDNAHPDTHPKTLLHCEDSGKVCYPSRKVATAVAHRVQKKRNTSLRVYFCDHCKYHHLTSQKP